MSNTELESYLQDIPEVARISAQTIAHATATMRLLIADEAKISPDEVSLELSFQAALETLKDYRKYHFHEYCREEIERLKPIVEAEKSEKAAQEERKRSEREAQREAIRSDASSLSVKNDDTLPN